MRWTALLLAGLASACAGPTQQQIAETPSASAPATHEEAPPASTSDKDRERAVQQWDDMATTQRAYREARPESQPPPPQTKAAAPKKKGPAEQAYLPAKKPAEPAPPQGASR